MLDMFQLDNSHMPISVLQSLKKLINSPKSEPKIDIHLYSLEYNIKLQISNCVCCDSNHRTNLVPFPNWAYTGLYWFEDSHYQYLFQ